MADGVPTTAGFVPPTGDLATLREYSRRCQGCDLYRDATQTVFGVGPAEAPVMVVGEQPGDIEDREGVPFVGPAGRLLDRAFAEAGLERERLYLTNAVKHFKFAIGGRGKRRIHQTPDRIEIVACRPWLLAEYATIRPQVIVVLGAVAAKALLGPAFRVTRSRGMPLPWPASAHRPEDFPAAADDAFVLATIHPSAVLRAGDRATAYEGLVKDLKVASDEYSSRFADRPGGSGGNRSPQRRRGRSAD